MFTSCIRTPPQTAFAGRRGGKEQAGNPFPARANVRGETFRARAIALKIHLNLLMLGFRSALVVVRYRHRRRPSFVIVRRHSLSFVVVRRRRS